MIIKRDGNAHYVVGFFLFDILPICLLFFYPGFITTRQTATIIFEGSMLYIPSDVFSAEK
jgi:hypothetical protein